jgi:hypothetical protein
LVSSYLDSEEAWLKSLFIRAATKRIFRRFKALTLGRGSLAELDVELEELVGLHSVATINIIIKTLLFKLLTHGRSHSRTSNHVLLTL